MRKIMCRFPRVDPPRDPRTATVGAERSVTPSPRRVINGWHTYCQSDTIEPTLGAAPGHRPRRRIPMRLWRSLDLVLTSAVALAVGVLGMLDLAGASVLAGATLATLGVLAAGSL